MLTTYGVLLIFSVTINLSVGVYFLLTPLLEQCFRKTNLAFGERITKLFEEKPGIVSRFFRDQIFSIIIFIYGITLLIVSDVFQNPFLEISEPILAAFALDLGHYVYRFFQDILLRNFIPLFKINLLHHIVTISTYAVFMLYKQNAISGVIGLLFEGSAIFFDLCGFLRSLGISKNSYLYINCVIIGFILTIICRALCPLTLLVVVFLSHSPLRMEYLPLGFFFMNIVFFTMVNGWLVKSSFDSLRRRILSRRILNELSRFRNVRALDDSQEITPGEVELNNLGASRQPVRQPVTIVIPADESFRLAPPVSNLNMDYSRALVSNITVSRHERTLPNINYIVNETSTTMPDTASITLSQESNTFV
ncbi:uncharacterized protein LOC116289640 [Actinia tenebrosa]|uniref:Uncharacterized protein LOC116289640 n=1 Tax=Actinia tenebrosa TaxID=6105 RepID=A0A6P8HIN6_ACTTE|nr:uncharacterized protein LOC116289640 [Actinia tenebrosa]